MKEFHEDSTLQSSNQISTYAAMRGLHIIYELHVNQVAGADPGYLEGGFRCVEEGVCSADFISFFLNIP